MQRILVRPISNPDSAEHIAAFSKRCLRLKKYSADNHRQPLRFNGWSIALLIFLTPCILLSLSGCVASAIKSTDANVLVASPGTVSFGAVSIGQAVGATVSLLNGGAAPIEITRLNLTGQSFSVVPPNSIPVTIAAGETYDLKLQFNPTAPGTATGQLTIASNSSTNTVAAITLNGAGTAAPAEVSAVACSNASMTGTTTDPCTITLNTAAPAGGLNVGLSSSNTAVTVPATVTVPANATSAEFTASASLVEIAQTATLTASAGGVAKTLDLQLNAAVPMLSINATSLTFGSVVVNTAAAPQVVTLISAGTVPVTINWATMTGAGFTVSGTQFPATLNPGQAAILNVQFEPTAIGTAAGQLLISSDSSGGGTDVISLSGTGTAVRAAGVASPTFSPAAGQYTVAQTVTIMDSTPSAVIYYTLNGTEPTTSSRKYEGPISVSASETLQAVAILSGSSSAVVSAAYLVEPVTNSPSSPNSSANFFGMNINYLLDGTEWPDVQFGTLRLWDTYTLWGDLNPASGSYVWGNLDRQLSLANANGAAVMLTFGGTPPWAIPTRIPIASISRSNGVVTVTTGSPHGLYFSPIQQPAAQSSVTVTGATDSSFDGTFVLTGTPTPNSFTYAQTGPNSQSSLGEISAVCGGPYLPRGCAEAPANLSDWNAYITQLMNHVGPGAIKYFELWNEPNLSSFWQGDPAILVTMAAHARQIIKTIDPNAVILSPSPTLDFETAAECASNDSRCGSTWLSNWLAAGGSQTIDAVAFHGYPAAGMNPEQIHGAVELLAGAMSQNGVESLPLWDTESSWGENSSLPDQIDQIAFLARHLIVEQSTAVQRSFWYSFDSQTWGILWSAQTGINPVADAYIQIHGWLLGATVTQPCSASASDSTTWSCLYSRSNGYSAEIVWNTAGQKPITTAAQFVQYRDLTGKIYPVTQREVEISTFPIILETSSETLTPPALTIPAIGSTLPGSAATFMWSAGNVGATAYQIKIGTTSVGSSDIYNGGSITGTSLQISNIPIKGAALYLRLLYEVAGNWYSIDYSLREATETAPSMISPAVGSTLSGSTTTFTWNGGVGSIQFIFALGTTGLGSSNIYAGSATTASSAQISNIPVEGVNVYARIYYEMNGVWSSVDSVYKEAGTPVLPSLTTPTPASKLVSSTVNFTWNPGAGSAMFNLKVGTTGPGTTDVFNGTQTTATTATVSGIPGYGVSLYVRLYYEINATWSYIDYLYKEAGTAVAPSMTTPTPTSTLTGPTVSFTWNPGGGSTMFMIQLGTAGAGSSNIYNGSRISAASTTVDNIPSNGVNLYVRLSYQMSGVWSSIDYVYTEAGTPALPSLTSPASGSTLSGSAVTLTWNPGAGCVGYILDVGTTYAGSTDVYNGSTTTASSAGVTDIPTNGVKLYVRLYYGMNGAWPHIDYVLTEAGTPVLPSLTIPIPASELTTSTVTFTWNPGAGSTAFTLKVGTTGAGSTNIYNGSQTTASSVQVCCMPTSGTVYVRLYYELSGVFSFIDYTYQENS